MTAGLIQAEDSGKGRLAECSGVLYSACSSIIICSNNAFCLDLEEGVITMKIRKSQKM